MYIIRLILAGLFMGLANLVPGVSGGTMILALGFYDRFIESFSNLSRLKFKKDDITFLGTLFFLSFLTILVLSTLIQFLMENFRPEMLALFIGLTLGGAPTLIKEIKGNGRGGSYWVSLLSGIVLMALVAFVFKPSSLPQNFFIFFMGGVIGSSAMILPGISGSYLLLILGLYLPIISAISDFKAALVVFSVTKIMSIGLEILMPFALGMLTGILALSNFLNFLLKHYQRATQTFLLGLLLGSVLGLYPFAPQSLDKLVRYQTTFNGKQVLKVHLYGKLDTQSKLYKNILSLKEYGPKVLISQKSELSSYSVEQARLEKAIILSFKQDINQQWRDDASDKKAGRVPLVVLSDTSYSLSRLLIILLLLFVGVSITYYIGTLKDKEKK